MKALLWLTLLIPGAEDAVPATAQRPYRVVICLRAVDHPILTPLFVNSVRREVHDQLGNCFGTLAEVDVRTTGHWLLDEYPHQDISQPDLTPQLLAAHPPEDKVFLIVLDYRDGSYQIHWRQADGKLLHVGPVCHRTTPDRQWVGKGVCLAIKEDFAVVADLEPGPYKETVPLKFRGREQAAQLTDLLGERCVLKPFSVLRQKDRLERRPIPNTYLYVDRTTGLHQAHVVTNLAEPWPQRAAIAGYEALRVSTQSGRIRLRLLDADTGTPVVNCTVMANDQGFDRLQPADQLGPPSREGYVLSQKTYRDLAYVKVTHGGATLKLPLPITDEVSELLVWLRVDRTAGQKDDFRRALRFLVEDTQSIRVMQTDAVREFNEFNKSKRYEEALQRVRGAIEFVEPRLQNAIGSMNRLQQQSRPLGDKPDPLLKLASQQIAEGGQRMTDLRSLQQALDTAIKKRDAQARANVVIKLGQQAEHDGDIDEALVRYRLALNEQPEQPELTEKIDKLQRAWETKGPEHVQARAFLCDRWAHAEADVATLLPEAIKAFGVLLANEDHLCARRLLKINLGRLQYVNDVIEQISQRMLQQNTPAESAELDKYSNLAQQIADFQTKVTDYLERALAKAPPATPPAGPAPPVPDDSSPDTPPATPRPATPPPAAKQPPADEEEEAPLR
jgi:tetratricopeptide (TPR) repeat protein